MAETDPANMIFPENRPKDVHGCPIDTPQQIEADMILNRRIARENAALEWVEPTRKIKR